MFSVLKSLFLLAASTRAMPIFSNDIEETYYNLFNQKITYDPQVVMPEIPNFLAKTGITTTSCEYFNKINYTKVQYGIFAGGSYTDNNGNMVLSKEVALFDARELTWSVKEILSIGRIQMATGYNSNDNIILAGGLEMKNNVLVPSALIEKYSYPLNSVSVMPCVLSPARYGIGAMKGVSRSMGVIFAGGFTSATSATDVVEIFKNSAITKLDYKLSKARGNIATARAFNLYGQIDLFVGGSEEVEGKKPVNAVDMYFESGSFWHSTKISVARSLIGTTSDSYSQDLNQKFRQNTLIFAGGFDGYQSVNNVDIYRVDNNYGVWSTASLPVPMCGLSGIPWSNGIIFAGGHTRVSSLIYIEGRTRVIVTMTPSDLVFVYINNAFKVIKLTSAFKDVSITIASFFGTRSQQATKSYLLMLGRDANGELVFDYLVKGDPVTCKAGEYRFKNECKMCSNGYYGDSIAALSTDPKCSGKCAAGRYGDSAGDFIPVVKPFQDLERLLTSSDDCSGICLPGYFCPPGSVSSNEFICPSNSFSDYGAGSCTTCSTDRSIGSLNQARKIKFVYVPDTNPLEVSLNFTDSTGNVLFSLNPGNNDMRGGTYEFDYNGAPKSKLTFTITDTGGDGICCKKSIYSYYMIYVDGVPIRRGGNFKSVDTYTFEAGQKQVCESVATPLLITDTSEKTAKSFAASLCLLSLCSISIAVGYFLLIF